MNKDEVFTGQVFVDDGKNLIKKLKAEEKSIDEDLEETNTLEINPSIKNKNFFKDEEVEDFLLNLKK